MPSIGSSAKDIGRHRTIAIGAESPGIAPNIRPITVPNTINSQQDGDVSTEKIPCIITADPPLNQDVVQRSKRKQQIEAHSKKPDEARDKIVSLLGDLPRVELFARQTPPGWDVWGNEVESTVPDFGTLCPKVGGPKGGLSCPM